MIFPTAFVLCKLFEGFRAKPYLCAAGVPTIGYGSTRYADGRPVSLQDPPISETEAAMLLISTLKRIEAEVFHIMPMLKLEPEPRVGAIISWVYNLGATRFRSSTMLRRMREGDWVAAGKECRRWNKAGGRILAGLVARREVEAIYVESNYR